MRAISAWVVCFSCRLQQIGPRLKDAEHKLSLLLGQGQLQVQSGAPHPTGEGTMRPPDSSRLVAEHVVQPMAKAAAQITAAAVAPHMPGACTDGKGHLPPMATSYSMVRSPVPALFGQDAVRGPGGQAAAARLQGVRLSHNKRFAHCLPGGSKIGPAGLVGFPVTGTNVQGHNSTNPTSAPALPAAPMTPTSSLGLAGLGLGSAGTVPGDHGAVNSMISVESGWELDAPLGGNLKVGAQL